MESNDYLRSYLKGFNKKTLHKLRPYSLSELCRELGRRDPAFFCKYYFPHYFSKPYSPMHIELFEDIKQIHTNPTGGKVARAAPRGYAKSTIVTTGQSLWNACYGFKKYIILCKDTGPQANLDLAGIKDELLTNELLQRDFPGICGEGPKWKENEIITRSGVMLQALGAGMKIRGRRYKQWRPDLVILDDIENEENTATPEQRKKLEQWFNGSVMKVGQASGKTDFFFIGTILHMDSLLNKSLQNPGWLSMRYEAVMNFASRKDLWDKWEQIYIQLEHKDRKEQALKFYQEHEVQMMQDVDTVWPEGASYYYLMTKKIEEGNQSFYCEYQNTPVSLEDALFKNFKYYEFYEEIGPSGGLDLYLNPESSGYKVLLSDCRLFGACDPSLGKTQESDYSAIIIGALSPHNRLFLLEADIKRRPPNKIMDAIYDHAVKYLANGLKFEKFAVESIAFQEFFKDQVAEYSARLGIFLPVVSTALLVVDGSKKKVKIGRTNKEVRIQTLEPDIDNGYILFHKTQTLLLDQLRYFPRAEHDDGPDALEMLRDLTRQGSSWAIS